MVVKAIRGRTLPLGPRTPFISFARRRRNLTVSVGGSIQDIPDSKGNGSVFMMANVAGLGIWFP